MSADTTWLVAYRDGGWMLLDSHGPEVWPPAFVIRAAATADGLYRLTWRDYDYDARRWPPPLAERVGDLPTLEAPSEAVAVREALGLLPDAATEDVLREVEYLRADNRRLLVERIELRWGWGAVARRARAWGRAEGLAEAQQAARARSRDWGAMTLMAVVLRSIARDLDPRDRVAHPDAPEEGR